MKTNTINIASQTGCPECWGSGIKEPEPFYYVACLWCGGTGLINKEDETHAKSQDGRSTKAPDDSAIPQE